MQNHRRGIGKAMIAGIVIIVVIVAVIGIYYGLPKPSKSATVIINMPAGVGSNAALNFNPASITVVIGVNNTIKWVNQDSVPHTVSTTSGPSEFGNDGTIAAGGSYTVTLTTAGTYHYHCTLHPANMQGIVIVKSG